MPSISIFSECGWMSSVMLRPRVKRVLCSSEGPALSPSHNPPNGWEVCGAIGNLSTLSVILRVLGTWELEPPKALSPIPEGLLSLSPGPPSQGVYILVLSGVGVGRGLLVEDGEGIGCEDWSVPLGAWSLLRCVSEPEVDGEEGWSVPPSSWVELSRGQAF